MKNLKSFKLFEAYDSAFFAGQNSRLLDISKDLVNKLTSSYVKIETKDSRSEDEFRQLRKEALEKVKNGDTKAYGAMKWDGHLCERFFIAAPANAIPVLQKPIVNSGARIEYLEDPGKWCVLDVGRCKEHSNSSSLYMEVDGDVLFQYNEIERKAKGKLV